MGLFGELKTSIKQGAAYVSGMSDKASQQATQWGNAVRQAVTPVMNNIKNNAKRAIAEAGEQVDRINKGGIVAELQRMETHAKAAASVNRKAVKKEITQAARKIEQKVSHAGAGAKHKAKEVAAPFVRKAKQMVPTPAKEAIKSAVRVVKNAEEVVHAPAKEAVKSAAAMGHKVADKVGAAYVAGEQAVEKAFAFADGVAADVIHKAPGVVKSIEKSYREYEREHDKNLANAGRSAVKVLHVVEDLYHAGEKAIDENFWGTKYWQQVGVGAQRVYDAAKAKTQALWVPVVTPVKQAVASVSAKASEVFKPVIDAWDHNVAAPARRARQYLDPVVQYFSRSQPVKADEWRDTAPVQVADPSKVTAASEAERKAMRSRTQEINAKNGAIHAGMDEQCAKLDELRKQLEKEKPDSENHARLLAEYEQLSREYEQLAEGAARTRARTRQAIEEELRRAYLGDARNADAAQQVAHEIAAAYRDNPQMQRLIGDALQTVKTETARQRDTAHRLYEYERASDEMQRLTFALGGKVDPAAYQAATTRYERRRAEALEALDNELQEARAQASSGTPTNFEFQQRLVSDDRAAAIDAAARGLAQRYAGDSEMLEMISAARIVRHARSPATTTDQMRLLGREMEAMDKEAFANGKPLTRESKMLVQDLVLADPEVRRITDRYVAESAQAVSKAYDDTAAKASDWVFKVLRTVGVVRDAVPAAEAAGTLEKRSNQQQNPAVMPRMAAVMMNQLYSPDGKGTLDKVIDDISGRGAFADTLRPINSPYPSLVHQDALNDLAAVTSRAAADTRPGKADAAGKTRMDWASKEAQQAVESTGKAFMRNVPQLSGQQRKLLKDGMEETVRLGHGTALALEVAHQERQWQGSRPDWKPRDGDKVDLAKETLDHVSSGYQGLVKTAEDEFEKQNAKMGPLLIPFLRAAEVMDPQQQAGALQKLMAGSPASVESFKQGKKALDVFGEQLLRDAEMVDLYGRADRLGAQVLPFTGDKGQAQAGYGDVLAARRELMDNERVKATLLASEPAALRANRQAVHSALDWGRNAGVVPAPALGPIPLGSVLLALRYVVPDVVENLKLEEKYGAGYARLGNSPGGALAGWVMGGAFQAANLAYAYNTANYDESQQWRKVLSLGPMAGSTSLTMVQGFGALTHHLVQSLPEGMKASLEQRFKLPSRVERATEFTRVANPAISGPVSLMLACSLVGSVTNAAEQLGKGIDGKPVDTTKLITTGINAWLQATYAGMAAKTAWRTRKFPVNTTPAARELAAQGKTPITSTAMDYKHLERIENWVENNRVARYLRDTALFPANASAKLGEVVGERSPIKFLKASPVDFMSIVYSIGIDLFNLAAGTQKAQAALQGNDQNAFTGGGMKPEAARILADRTLVDAGPSRYMAGESQADGLIEAYHASGADKARFVEWINGLSAEQVLKLRNATDTPPDRRASKKQDAFLALPLDPSKADLSGTRIAYNTQRQRYEDATTQTYYQASALGGLVGGQWVSDASIGPTNSDVRPESYGSGPFTYSPRNNRLTNPVDQTIPLSPRSSEGFNNWLKANGMPLPPRPSLPPLPAPQEPADGTLREVRKGDTLWSLSGQDARIEQEIRALNPWIDDSARLREGDVLNMPPGMARPGGEARR